MPDPPGRANLVVGTITASVAIAGVLAGATVHFGASDPAEPPAAVVQPSVPPDGPLSQQGTIVAVTADSVTARSVDGFTQTYRIAPDATAITDRGPAQPGAAAEQFTVNDEVVIVGTVRNGTAVATAVADRALAGLNGPPMDFDLPPADSSTVTPVSAS